MIALFCFCKKHLSLFIIFFLFLISINALAQTPGLIVRPASGAGVNPLNPNGDAFTSPTAAGFITSDVGVGYSEILYKTIPAFILEPTSDLMRGPGGLFTDLVRTTADESGLYVFNDGTNLLFRMRMGSIVSGSKGYSVLIDTDQKFGSSGASADPNYQPATTSSNGNPGFELEVVLETNFRVAVYNVDGASTPTLLSTYGINTNSQISVALSTVSGTPDYFYDFYVPISALPGITVSTPLRLSATTVMSPQAAIGGPKSDIYGVDDSGKDYMKDWETVINGQKPFTPGDITSSGPGVNPSCTAPPTLNSPIATGTVTISGTWTRADATKPSTATITLYKNGVALGTTTTVTTGNTWSITGITAANGDVFYAKAQASFESSCLQSNSVTANSCTTLPAAPVITCASQKGITGNIPANSTILLYQVTPGNANPATTQITTNITYPTSTTFAYYNNNCSGVGSPLTAGATYMIKTVSAAGCISGSTLICIQGSSSVNVLSSNSIALTTPIFPYQTSFSGTGATSGEVLRLFINDIYISAQTATGSNFTFSGLTLKTGDQLKIYSQPASSCMTISATFAVSCYVQPPAINAVNNQVAAGTAISGTSNEPAGTTIRLYNAANTLLATVTVQAGGTWTTAINAAAATSYYAVSQTACGSSVNSATVTGTSGNATIRCGTITGPVNETATSVSGTLAGTAVTNTTVRLFADGYEIGSVATATNAWSIPVNTTFTNGIYPGAVLTISVQEPSRFAEQCVASVTVSCSAPATPLVTPATVTVSNANGQTNFTVSNSQSGVLYTLENLSGTDQSVSVFGNDATISLTSYAFLTPGIYNLQVTALKLSGSCATATAPVTLTVGDNDNDGIADVADIDDDNDGVLDTNEISTYNATGDADGDGIPNYRDTTPGGGLPSSDSNGDGIIDAYDSDKDGIINQFDLDSDNDGIPDIIENGGTDANNDGKVDGTTDTDGDGLRDAVDANTSGASGSNGIAVLDTDKDGIPNAKDLDADGDGILDTRETGLADTNNDGIADGALGTDGWSDMADALPALNLPDNDGDGKFNFLDIDADNDGLTDSVEGQSTAGYQLPSGMDTDGDGIDDVYDNNDAAYAGNANNGITPYNHDGADTPDYIDSDSDNDGVTDLVEGTGNGSITLTNTTDTDGDGLVDQFDIFSLNTQTTNLQNNVTLAGMGNGGSTTGPASAGSSDIAKQTPPAATNRDWRNSSFFILPVSLISFGAEERNGFADIKWVAESEINFLQYVVERSANGRDFITAGIVTPYNNGGRNNYRFIDNIQQLNAPVVYYRLKMVDLDGKTDYSAIVRISVGKAVVKKIVITPNPITENMQIRLSSDVAAVAKLQITNASGQVLYHSTQQVYKGENSIPVNNLSGKLAKGIYTVSACMDGQMLTTKFLF